MFRCNMIIANVGLKASLFWRVAAVTLIGYCTLSRDLYADPSVQPTGCGRRSGWNLKVA